MTNETISIDIHDNIYYKVHCTIEQAHELKGFFSCYATNYKYNPKYKARQWDGKIYYFNTYDRLLPRGLLKFMKAFLLKYNYKIHFMFDKSETQNDIEQEDLESFYNALFSGTEYYPRDYQQKGILEAVKNKRGILEIATGGGKSLVVYSLIRFMMEDVDNKVLLIVPSVSLVNQMYSDFENYGWGGISKDVSKLYGATAKNIDLNKKVLISTWQSIYKKGQSFFEKYDAVLCDETHLASGNSIQSVLKKCVNAEYRIGLTGTLPDEPIDKFNIFGYIGTPLYTLTSDVLIKSGHLSDIRIVNMHIKYSSDDVSKVKGLTYAEEVDFIIKHKQRNSAIKYIIDSKHIKDDENILILAQRISHINDIIAYLKKEYPNRKIVKIDGATDGVERERLRSYVEGNDSVILVATYGTLSTGVSINRLHHVVFASFCKSKIRVIQSIGRGLRKHSSKSVMIVWDLVDDLRWKKKNSDGYNHNYAYKHFLDRLEFYKKQKFRYINKIVNISNE